MSKWIAEFELEDGDTMPEHMDLEYKGAKIDFHCRPLSSSENPNKSEIPTGSSCVCGNRYKQEPKKGHWKLVQRGKCIDVCCSSCKATRIKEWAYNYTIDQLDKKDIKECLGSGDMRYCPYCGSDNREVEE